MKHPANLSEHELIVRAVAGESWAYDQLTQRYYHKIASLVRYSLRDTSVVDDITQDVFFKAYRALANFEFNSNFYTWLYAITINTIKNHLKEIKNRPIIIDFNDEISHTLPSMVKFRDYSTPENWYYFDEMQVEISQAISGLSNELRCSLLLREIEGLSYEEIAQKMVCPVGTVRSRIARARAIVESEVKQYVG